MATGSIQGNPWKPASQVVKALGVNMALFGHPGSGKTTLLKTAQDSEYGRDVIVIDMEGGTRSISDRDDVMVATKPGTDGDPLETWDDVSAVSELLRRQVIEGTCPFKTIGFDTLSAAQRLTLQKVMKASPTPDMPSQPEYGKANELLLDLVRKWCEVSRRYGVNVIFNCHAVEEKDESTGIVLIRMSLTPGVIKGVYQAVDSIGYIAADPKTNRRRLLLRETPKVLAKFRQPQSGPQLPLEIDDPDLGNIIEHVKGIEPFTAPAETGNTGLRRK